MEITVNNKEGKQRLIKLVEAEYKRYMKDRSNEIYKQDDIDNMEMLANEMNITSEWKNNTIEKIEETKNILITIGEIVSDDNVIGNLLYEDDDQMLSAYLNTTVTFK